MKRIVVSTSSSGLDYHDKPDNIRMLRFNIILEKKDYHDGLDLTSRELANIMTVNRDVRPITVPPTLEEVIEFFETLYEEGFTEVFVVTLSSHISPTYEVIHEAKSYLIDKMFVHVFDSKTIAYPEAYLALSASKMLYEGKNTLEVAEQLHRLRENSASWFVIDDISNLIRTGRMSAPLGYVAKIFDIKPILEINQNGELKAIAKVRNVKKATTFMCKKAIESMQDRPGKLFIIHIGDDEKTQMVSDILQTYGLNDLDVYEAASTAIANHGPFGVGLGIVYDC